MCCMCYCCPFPPIQQRCSRASVHHPQRASRGRAASVPSDRGAATSCGEHCLCTPPSNQLLLSPVQRSSQQLSLEVGEDRLLLIAHPLLYHLDIDLPFMISDEDAGAQFNNSTKVDTEHLL